MRSPSRDRRALAGFIIAVIVVIIVVVALLALIIVPFREASIDEARQAPLVEGVESLNLTIEMDRGSVEVRFIDNATNAVAMSVRGTERSGLLGPGEQANVTWADSSSGNEQVVTASVRLGNNQGLFFTSNINCTVLIAKQLRTALTVTNGLGAVEVVADDGVVLTSADIRASTGGARLVMGANATLDGPLTMETSLGGIDLEWTDAVATDAARFALRATTGGINVDIFQYEPLGESVTVNATSNLGGINLAMDLRGNNSARVQSSAQLGGVNVERQDGFEGTNEDLSSQNYPDAHAFEAVCHAETGGVNLDLRYSG